MEFIFFRGGEARRVDVIMAPHKLITFQSTLNNNQGRCDCIDSIKEETGNNSVKANYIVIKYIRD